ncbi:MAG: DUF3093 family protein, partial [Candidatus Nanopelagicales bacterium]
MVFRERLWVPWWAWPVAGSGPVALGVAYGHATSNTVGWLVGAATGVLVAVALFKAAAEVTVDTQQLTAGRAIGYGEASDLFAGATGPFAGQIIDSSSVVIAYTVVGDASL